MTAGRAGRSPGGRASAEPAGVRRAGGKGSHAEPRGTRRESRNPLLPRKLISGQSALDRHHAHATDMSSRTRNDLATPPRRPCPSTPRLPFQTEAPGLGLGDHSAA
jgi:hypothetical protein